MGKQLPSCVVIGWVVLTSSWRLGNIFTASVKAWPWTNVTEIAVKHFPRRCVDHVKFEVNNFNDFPGKLQSVSMAAVTETETMGMTYLSSLYLHITPLLVLFAEGKYRSNLPRCRMVNSLFHTVDQYLWINLMEYGQIIYKTYSIITTSNQSLDHKTEMGFTKLTSSSPG